jgi:hypothetical protein
MCPDKKVPPFLTVEKAISDMWFVKKVCVLTPLRHEKE